MTNNITGSWFPEGFHGYTKLSRARNDVNMVYRHLAKPLPPATFIGRAKQPPTKHCFSHHDNRKIFLCDPQSLTQGLGKKKFNKYNTASNLVAWRPDEEYLKCAGPLRSTYERAFRSSSPKDTFTHKYLQRNIPTSPFYDNNTSLTSYQLELDRTRAYSRILKPHMFDPCWRKVQYSQITRPQTAPPTFKESVASCMQWYIPTKRSLPPA